MPSKYSFFKSNRSQASLLETQDQQLQNQRSSGRSPLPSPGLPPHTQVAQDNRFEQRSPEEPNKNQYRSGVLSRRQSQRLTAGYSGPTVNLVANPQDDTGLYAEEPRRESYAQVHSLDTHQHQDHDTKRSKRSLFGFTSKDSQRTNAVNEQQQTQQRVSQGSLGRSISVRRKEPPPALKQQSPTNEQQHNHHWSVKRNSATQLPTSSEEEEGNTRVEPAEQSPPVPAKDSYGRSINLKLPTTERQQLRGSPSRKGSDFAVEDQTHYNRNEFVLPPRDQSLQASPLFPPDPQTASQDHSQYQAYQPSLLNTTNPHPSHSQRLLPLDLPSPSAYHPQTENQQGRPPSQASSQLQYQAYDPQAHNLGHPVRRAPSEEAQEIMAPPLAPPRQANRQTGTNVPNAPNGPSREVSSLQVHEQGTQGQIQPTTPNGPQFVSPPPIAGQPNQNYRGGPPQQQQPGQPGEVGRSTPPLNRPPDESASLDVAQILARLDELQSKYSKVKKYYFEKDAQVHQLQNTLAHQRLAQSRTSLDDSEYATRFNRLDGAINNLAFNIRKDWKAIPPWLASVVNQDAHKTGTKEMTAIGRACISKWIVDEILDRYFHPGLEPTLSSQLKIIEKNVRKFAPQTHSNEEDDALLAKISNWRLTTLDGLTEMLSSPQSMECRTALTETLITKLIASLQMNLKDPAPPGLEGGVSMIIELAVGIAANLPLESRDVYVEYPMAGTLVNPETMKLETGLPALTNPGASLESLETDKSSLSGGAGGDASSQVSDPKDSAGAAATTITSEQGGGVEGGAGGLKEHTKKKGVFGNFMNKKPALQAPGVGVGGIGGGIGGGISGEGLQKPMDGSQVSLAQQGGGQRPTSSAGQRGEVEVQRVRFAAFMAVEVRGRSVLVKAPVYT